MMCEAQTSAALFLQAIFSTTRLPQQHSNSQPDAHIALKHG
uniref:Uncharacterized protein n=1 Tax=Anguilla anguilla TaxID=7936 RepID=A0A0E9VUJ3_ANGAN